MHAFDPVRRQIPHRNSLTRPLVGLVLSSGTAAIDTPCIVATIDATHNADESRGNRHGEDLTHPNVRLFDLTEATAIALSEPGLSWHEQAQSATDAAPSARDGRIPAAQAVAEIAGINAIATVHVPEKKTTTDHQRETNTISFSS